MPSWLLSVVSAVLPGSCEAVDVNVAMVIREILRASRGTALEIAGWETLKLGYTDQKGF